ncbi:hypothetical protein E4631_24650 [Hymenobacter sp. UV11]|uniref:hypothetical protein n=1 Tax=Hymenobacter sp. UV11 TaxID=1849735 RepID=UPI00105F71D1|nr:hypothetical protein [Hymenobacter sp. UV11]TFZ62745.1 hypothetical protein E4631_24650 [Hymenobacter sp. UV11]
MAYRKRPATARTCVHCHDAYEAVDRRRLYCGDSCKVQACKAKRRRRLAAKASGLAAPSTPVATPTTPTPSPQTLEWNLQNLAVLGTAAALGNLGVKVGERVVEGFTQPSSAVLPALPAPPLQLVDPLSWLPAGLLTANAPRVSLESSALGRPVLFVELRYLGHLLYYQPSQRLLLWRAAPGNLQTLGGPDEVAYVAEQVPCDAYGESVAPSLGTGSELQTLG